MRDIPFYWGVVTLKMQPVSPLLAGLIEQLEAIALPYVGNQRIKDRE
jgi:hypothetical protein